MTVLVIGDYIRDRYIIGTASRLDPATTDAPVLTNPIVKLFRGGAFLVHDNLKSFRFDVEILTDWTNIARKTRIVNQDRIIARYDEEMYVEAQLPAIAVKDYKMLVLSDYNKGALWNPQDYIYRARSVGVPVIVDPKKPLKAYTNANVVKLNMKEFREECNIQSLHHCNYQEEMLRLCQSYNFDAVIVTNGRYGSRAMWKQDDVFKYEVFNPRVTRNSIDPTGAGDVFLAALSHFYLQGPSFRDAVDFATQLAGISVEHLGPYVLTHNDILSVI